jgi:hypothetical protein
MPPAAKWRANASCMAGENHLDARPDTISTASGAWAIDWAIRPASGATAKSLIGPRF